MNAWRSVYLLPGLWAIAGIVLFGVQISRGIGFADSALDIPIHDNYFVIAGSHVAILTMFAFMIGAGAYMLIPRWMGKRLNILLGVVHLAGTVLLFSWLLLPSLATAMLDLGRPQRYYSYTQFDQGIVRPWFILVVVAQFAFVANIVYSASRGPRIEAK